MSATRTVQRRVAAFALISAAVASPWIVDAYTISLASYALVMALLAVSAHTLSATTGLASLGQAAFFGLGAYTATRIAQACDASGPVQLLAATAVAAAAAAIIGAAVARTRATVFMVATLAIGELAHVAAENLRSLTGGGNGLAAPPIAPWPGGPALVLDGHIYLYVLAVAALVVCGVRLLLGSHAGLVWRGIADHEPRVAANGYHTAAHVWIAYVLAGAVAGAAGALLIASRRYVSPSDLAFDISALALLAAILGGRHLAGAVAAALAIVIVRDMSGNLLVGYSPLLLGCVFIAAALWHSHTASRHARHAAGRRIP